MNNMELKDLVVGEICLELQGLESIEIGTDAYKATVDGLTKLVDRTIELDKLEQERLKQEKQQEAEKERHEAEMLLKKKQYRADLADKIVKNVLNGVSVVGGLTVIVWGTCVSIKFEETGVFTTTAGRNFINALFKKNI